MSVVIVDRKRPERSDANYSLCDQCGVRFRRRPSQNRSTLNYCTRKCSGLARSSALGTTRVQPDGYVEERVATGWVKQHRMVMEQLLGRRLAPFENVHHRNGQRHDNRASNLELWVTKQPLGQRPEDLVVWAKEILALYGDEL